MRFGALSYGLPLLGLAACGAPTTEPAQAEATTQRAAPSARAVRVEVVALEGGDATLELDLPGEVTGQRDASLAAANGGFVEAVMVVEGAAVSQGQALMRVDTALFSAQLEQADAQLDQAKADLRRIEALGDLGTDAQLVGARTQVRVAEAGRSLAATRLSRAIIKAPFDGVVASVGAEVGEALPPGGTALRLVQLDPAVITMSVSDRDVVALAEGAEVSVGTSALSGLRTGRVVRIAPAADTRTRAFPVEVEVPNSDGALLPGMIARVSASRPVADGAMVIPQDWIVTLRDEQGVFVTKGDVAEWRDIELGEVIHDRVVVRSGIQPGDRIVINGHRDLVDGDPLIVAREGRCCADGRPTFGN